MTEEEKLKRAENAAHLLSSDAFLSIMEELEAEQIAVFADSEPAQEDDRHDAYFMMRALKSLRSKLQTYADEKSAHKHREESRKLHS